MVDIGHNQTEKVLESLERRLAREYAQAYKEVEKKAADYFKRFEVKDNQKKALVDAGKLTEKEYQTWRRNQMLSGKRWTDLRDQLAKDLTNTNQIAAGIVRGELDEVFAINANYSEYMIENGMRTNYGFTLYDRNTIANLAKNDPDIIPWKPEVDIPADLRWNRQMITSHITQGILQGESIPNLSKRLLKTVNNDKVAAVRTARTAVTSSQNAGRQMVYDRAKRMGLKLQKSWVATLDARTRHEHGAVDGQTVPLDGEFTVDGYKMKYPGDMSAPGYLVYSCRCTTITVEPDYITKGEEPRMTYSEWVESKEGKEATGERKKTQVQKSKKNNASVVTYKQTQTLANYDEYIEWANDGLKYHLEDAQEGWKSVPSQAQAIKTFEEEIPHYMQQFEEAVEKFDFSTRTDSRAVLSILKDGRFKSQIETGASHGVLDVEKRKHTTSRLFTMGEESGFSDNAFEIYGYLDSASRASMYGDCKIVLKKKNLMQRTTFTVGDSLELLESGADPFASLVARPNFSSWGQTVFSDSIPNAPQQLDRIRKDFSSIAQTGHLSGGNYVELQFHGGVTVDDIEYVLLSRSATSAQEIEELAKKAGVKIKWTK